MHFYYGIKKCFNKINNMTVQFLNHFKRNDPNKNKFYTYRYILTIYIYTVKKLII